MVTAPNNLPKVAGRNVAEATAADWQLRPSSQEAVKRLRASLGVSGLLAQVICARGLADPDAAATFLDPAPPGRAGADLPGVVDAVRIIKKAKKLRKTIAVFGDYDADGVIATAVIRHALAKFGCKGQAPDGLAEFYIPHRSEEGYGLNPDAIGYLAGRGVELLITVDCGITSHPEIAQARALGMEVVVTDHHLPSAELPPANAIVHPEVSGGVIQETANDPPCGALVALGLAQGLLGEVDPGLLDLVAVATIADVVPLLGRNRALVHHRLKVLPQTTNEGLRALLATAELDNRPLVARDIAFGIAPRLNAMGRVGNAEIVVNALNTTLPLRALEWAQQMDQANRLRRSWEEEVLAQALRQLDAEENGAALPDGLVVAGAGWYVGVVGIVAARLARRYRRPAAVIAVEDGVGYGSARSVPGLDLFQAIEQCHAHLDRFGGHRQAVGFRLVATRIADFAAAFAASVTAQGSPRQLVELDAVVGLADLDEQSVSELKRLEPVGNANPDATLAALGCTVVSSRRVGQDEAHLKMRLRQGTVVRDAIAFGLGDELAPLMDTGAAVDVAFTPEINTYMGRSSVQLRVTAARRAQPHWLASATGSPLNAQEQYS